MKAYEISACRCQLGVLTSYGSGRVDKNDKIRAPAIKRSFTRYLPSATSCPTMQTTPAYIQKGWLVFTADRFMLSLTFFSPSSCLVCPSAAYVQTNTGNSIASRILHGARTAAVFQLIGVVSLGIVGQVMPLPICVSWPMLGYLWNSIAEQSDQLCLSRRRFVFYIHSDQALGQDYLEGGLRKLSLLVFNRSTGPTKWQVINRDLFGRWSYALVSLIVSLLFS